MSDKWTKIRDFMSRHPILTNLLAICITGVVIVWLVLMFIDVWTFHGKTSTVPEIKSLSYADAEALLRDNDLTIEISDSVYNREVAPGTVIESWPKAGAVVKAGRQVYVTVNAFSPKQIKLTMPVSGVSQRQAMSHLQSLGITAIRVVHVPSQYDGLVERATADGNPLTVGSIIPVTASVTLEVGEVPVFTNEDFDDDEVPHRFENPTLDPDGNEDY